MRKLLITSMLILSCCCTEKVAMPQEGIIIYEPKDEEENERFKKLNDTLLN